VAGVCVFCSSSPAIEPSYLDVAAELGDLLARRGHVLVSGGGSVSSMGAVARAARAAGGRTVGVIPGFLADLEIADHDAAELVVTPSMRERKAEMERRSDAFIVLAGGLGTLEELFEMWVGRTLGVHGKPVVMCDPHGVFDPLREQLQVLVARGFARADVVATLLWASTPAEAVELVERAVAADAAGCHDEPVSST
jgi:uncharacterized protein (TIGR00730 family)